MAYQGVHEAQQRPYKGYANQPPTPRGQGQPQPYGGQEAYNGYNEANGRGNYNTGYDQGASYGPNHGHQVHQDRTVPVMGRPPPGRDRVPQGSAPGPAVPQGQGSGRGGARGPYAPGLAVRRPVPQSQDQRSYNAPRQPQGGRPPQQQESYVTDQMAAMNLNGRAPPGGSSLESQRIQGDYGYPAMNPSRAPPTRGPPPQSYESSRRPPPGSGPGDLAGYNEGYGARRNEFSPPARSMTMPISDQRQQIPPQVRADNTAYQGPAGSGMPPRPATATSNRPPPQRAYPQGPDSYGVPADGSRHYSHVSVDDVFDTYYDTARNSVPEQGFHAQQPSHADMPGYSNHQQKPQGQGYYDQYEQPGYEQQHFGPHQTAQLGHATSVVDVPEPQAAIFEMAGDIPSVPPVPSIAHDSYQARYDQGYNGQEAYGQMPPRGPSAPPGPQPRRDGAGHPNNQPVQRPGTVVPYGSTGDALPAHATPVRPGLMQNSMVNPNNRPPPVRNYGIAKQALPPEPQQQQVQQYTSSPPQSTGPPPPKQPEKPVTTQELEHLRMVIKNNPNDQDSALRLARRLIEASDVLIANQPDPRARAKARDRYLMDAHKILKKLAAAQNLEAMFTLADSLGRGLFSHEPDNKEAFTIYQSAAKLGHAAAAYRTAVCCEIGHEEGGGTRRDPLKAMQWYKRSATLGDAPAMYKVGMILLKGLLGQARNPREAVGWLKRAAERADVDNPHALHELGLLYESAQPNDTIIRDEPYALNLFQQAAELGYKFSQFRLGCVYEYGLMGCPINPRLSIVWYSKAAMQEEHQSELALSGWYLTGSDNVLGQSDTEAYLWARKAAVAGLAKAEYAMGYFTEVGIGVPPNLEDAKRWYWRAAAQDYPKARERLEDLKRAGKNSAPRPRERISRSRIERQQEGECNVM